jgi:ribosomal protein L34
LISKADGVLARDTTPLGRKALKAAKSKVRELFGELIEGE